MYSTLGLPGMLFSLLDYEVDPAMISNIHDTINSIMHSMVTENLSSWLALCREVNEHNFTRAISAVINALLM